MASRRRTLSLFLTLLALFLLGTVAVLSTISFYLGIDAAAYITDDELPPNRTHAAERIPRILHQTWKSETLPERWRGVAQSCRELMPDYEYILWTDAKSREFIATHYHWFLPTFDAYEYPIQRADAIRYFILHFYGGVYLDLDIGCKRPLDDLLRFPVVLPKTIPVGVSNDLMFAEKGHPFMQQTIHNLVTFDHSYVLNYPTVMFSTGPMFLSAQYGLYTSSHPPSPEQPGGEVRILPKSLYGKNAKPDEAPNAYFEHYYGSSWHSDDASFITFLGKWGKLLMWIGLFVLIGGIARLLWQRKFKRLRGDRPRRRLNLGGYEVVLPRAYVSNGSFHFDLGVGPDGAPEPSETSTEPSSPVSLFNSTPSSPTSEGQVLPLHFDMPTPPSDEELSESFMDPPTSFGAVASSAARRAGRWMMSTLAGSDRSHSRRRRDSSRGTLFFLPAIFTPSSGRVGPVAGRDIPLLSAQIPDRRAHSPPRRLSSIPRPRPRVTTDLIDTSVPEVLPSEGSGSAGPSSAAPPPPYDPRVGKRRPGSEWVVGDEGWDGWTAQGDEPLI